MAGANVNSAIAASQAMIQIFSDNAEAYVNSACRYDFVAASSAIISGYPNIYRILSGTIGAIAAIDCISYDMSGYTGRGEAEDMINVLYDRKENGIEYLKAIKKPEVVIT